MSEYRELLIGAGSNHVKRLWPQGRQEWTNLTTLDLEERHHPDIVWDLNDTPWGGLAYDGEEWAPSPEAFDYPKLRDSSFDEIHAYEVLEHLGQQGDFRAFFATFREIYRLLKPNGRLFATTPSPSSPWAWGDPGHTRIIGPQCLIFLQQPEYTKQVGVTPMSDYRNYFEGDFDVEYMHDDGNNFRFVLKAIKPSRIT